MRKSSAVLGICCTVWMFIIYMFSAQPVELSKDVSNSAASLIIRILEPGQHPFETDSENTQSTESGTAVPDSVCAENDTVPSTPSKPSTVSESVSAEKPSFFGKLFADKDEIVPNNTWFGISPGQFKSQVRVFAHFFLFLVLGILTYCFTLSIKKRNKPLSLLACFAFCVGYALLDEFHQNFVDGRGAQLTDVYTDSLGAVLGIVLTAVLYHLAQAMKAKKTYNSSLKNL